MWGILLAASLVLLVDSLIRYDNGEGSVWEIGLSLLGVVSGGRLLTALGKVAGLSAVSARVVAATSRGLAAGRATVVEMSQGVRMGLHPDWLSWATRQAVSGCCRRERRTDSAHCAATTSTWTTALATRPMSQAARPAWTWTRVFCDPVCRTRSSRGVMDVSVSPGIKADTSSRFGGSFESVAPGWPRCGTTAPVGIAEPLVDPRQHAQVRGEPQAPRRWLPAPWNRHVSSDSRPLLTSALPRYLSRAHPWRRPAPRPDCAPDAHEFLVLHKPARFASEGA